MKKNELLDAEGVRRAVARLGHEVVESIPDVESLALVGIRTRGDYLAQRLAKVIEDLKGKPVPVGLLDITLYRDDLRGRLEQPELKSTEILFDITGKNLVLVDDVLYTGRTIRSALNALMDIGRPSRIFLLVLVDRGHRELPIKADFVGKNIPTSAREQVRVSMSEIDKGDSVYIFEPDQTVS